MQNSHHSFQSQAKADKKHYEDLAAQTLRDGYHNLAWEYQKKANKAERLLNGVVVDGLCLCGVDGCKGLDFILDGEEPF